MGAARLWAAAAGGAARASLTVCTGAAALAACWGASACAAVTLPEGTAQVAADSVDGSVAVVVCKRGQVSVHGACGESIL